jgi:hypothetical protein
MLAFAGHSDSIPTQTPPVESQDEKPDWNDWPSIVRWAAQLEPDSQAALVIARGAPVGPSPGADVALEDMRHGPRLVAPADEPLTVVSGYLDDRRQMIGPDHRLYASATYAYAYRDYWTNREHRDYWRTHLHLWPSRKGRRSDRESLAFAIVNAETIGVALDELLSAIGYTRDDLRDRNVLDLADRMRAEIDAGPTGVRVPLVVTDDELDGIPLLTTHQALDVEEGAANVKGSALARDVVIRGAAEAARCRRAGDQGSG